MGKSPHRNEPKSHRPKRPQRPNNGYTMWNRTWGERPTDKWNWGGLQKHWSPHLDLMLRESNKCKSRKITAWAEMKWSW